MGHASGSRIHSAFSRLLEIVENRTGTVVNMHDVSGITLEVEDLRLKQDQYLHHGPYCRFAKFHGRNRLCSQNKLRSIAKASRVDQPFSGQCPLGVWEIAWPLKHEGNLLCILYLGHFQGKQPLQLIGKAHDDGPKLSKVRKVDVVELKKMGKLLEGHFMLIYLNWLDGGGQQKRGRSDKFYKGATERFIESHYTERVRLQDFAKQLQLHPHYLGKEILRVCGDSFLSLLRKRRIEQAKVLLSFTEHSITRIAYDVGFQDSNYFSSVFRKTLGLSPREYRRQQSEAKA